jgi:hypothetical protein
MTDAARALFRGFRFLAKVIPFGLYSYRDLEAMLADRGVEIEHTSICCPEGAFCSGAKRLSKPTLIETAKLNGIDPQVWLTEVLKRIGDYKISITNKAATPRRA